MTSGEKLTTAIINTFPIVKLLCDTSESEKKNLEATLGLLPEKFVKSMVRGDELVLDGDDMVDKDGIYSYIVGPESELNSNQGILRMEYKGPTFGSGVTTNLEIVCNARPSKGSSCEVLKYSVMDNQKHKPKYRVVSISVDEQGRASVGEELSDRTSLRGFTRSEYRTSYENE